MKSAVSRKDGLVQAGGADSASGGSGGSGGSGMECMQLRSPPGPFHYLISEQAKSFVALQELQNEVGALLEFRDLVIETFPNLRSKMAPSTGGGAGVGGASGGARDWEPGVRVRRKLAAPGDAASVARAKPQPSVQDSGFSTETSCKDAHSSASAAPAAPSPCPCRPAPLEDELWALLDVIQRKGVRLRDDAELLRDELDPHGGDEDRFARALAAGCPECGDARRLRRERDALLARTAELEAAARARPEPDAPDTPQPPATPLGRLDRVLATPPRPPRVRTPDSTKFAAILRECNPVELQRHLLTSTVHAQALTERLQRAASQRALLLDRLERAREESDDLKFQLEEKSIELEGTRARVRLLEGGRTRGGDAADAPSPARSRSHSSMRDMQPLRMPDAPAAAAGSSDRITDTPKRGRRSRIPLPGPGAGAAATHKPHAPKPPSGRASMGRDRDRDSVSSYRGESQSWRAGAAPASASRLRAPSSRDSSASARGGAAGRREPVAAAGAGTGKKASSVPVRRVSSATNQRDAREEVKVEESSLAGEYVARSERLQRLLARAAAAAASPPPRTLALELASPPAAPAARALWDGKPQQYFESINMLED